mgnify:CR=1 FL=1
MHYKSNIKELKSLSETREELREYQCMMDRKHKSITIYAKRVELYEVEVEDMSENEAIAYVTEAISSNDIRPDDSEVTIEDMDIR